METSTKLTLKSTDRLTQTLAAFARLLDQTMNDIQAVNSEFQDRVQQVTRDTESAQQRQAELLKSATEEEEQQTRSRITEELQTRFSHEMSAAVESARAELNAERDRLSQELDSLRKTAAGWESERSRLIAECERANQLLEQNRSDYDRTVAETDEAAALALERQISSALDRARADYAKRWDAERAQLAGERDRAVQALADQEAAHRQALADAQRKSADSVQSKAAAAFEQWEVERAKLLVENQRLLRLLQEAATTAKSVDKDPIGLEALKAEVTRVEGLIQSISEVISDPNTELSVVIRKNAERAELESYLRGVRFHIKDR